MPALYSDAEAISKAYDSVVKYERNWLLLETTATEEPRLIGSGYGGLQELKGTIESSSHSLDQAFVAFYKEEGEEPEFLLINYAPSTVSAVLKARALVYSRRLGIVFKKHQTTLTIDALSQLTPDAVRQALYGTRNQPLTASLASMDLADKYNKPLPHRYPIQPMRRTVSENTPATIAPIPIVKSSSMFTNIIRRKQKTDVFSVDQAEDDPPPPTPPKDKGVFGIQPSPQEPMAIEETSLEPVSPLKWQPKLQREIKSDWSDTAAISHSSLHTSEGGVIVAPARTTSLSDQKPKVQSLSSRGRWAIESLNPAERARQREAAQRQREKEEEEILREDAIRQAELKRMKEEALRQEMEYMEKRRISIEEEARQVAAERRLKEQLEKEQDERKRRELEEHKTQERERRREEHRKLEAWRREQTRLAEEDSRRRELRKKEQEEERQVKIEMAEARLERTRRAASTLTGWVTIQTDGSPFWKRRFYRFIGDTMFLYKSPKDISVLIDKVELRGRLRGLKEWSDGYEELESIPYSFAVEFKDGRGSWGMFSDSEEEKYELLGLLHLGAGL